MNEHKILDSKIEVEISPTAPFSFDGTFHKPSHFPTPDNYYTISTYWQSFRFQDQLYGLKLVNSGSVENPRFVMSIYYESYYKNLLNIKDIVREIEFRYDLQSDMRAFTTSCENDNVLNPAIQRWRGMRVSTSYSFYEFTVITTILQNTVIRRSVQMIKNLFETYGKVIEFDGKSLYAFWLPQSIASVEESALRRLKVGYRAKTLKRQAAEFFLGNIELKLWRTLDKESLKKELLKMYGIGPATVQYILFEVFHHYDALEHISPWEQKIYSRLLFEKELVETSIILNELDSRYGSWKMLAMHYIFENLFWLRKNENIPWLEELIRL